MDTRGSNYQKRKRELTLGSLMRKVEKTKLTVLVPTKLHKEFKVACTAKDVSISDVVLTAVQEFLRDYEAEEAQKVAKMIKEREDSLKK